MAPQRTARPHAGVVWEGPASLGGAETARRRGHIGTARETRVAGLRRGTMAGADRVSGHCHGATAGRGHVPRLVRRPSESALCAWSASMRHTRGWFHVWDVVSGVLEGSENSLYNMPEEAARPLTYRHEEGTVEALSEDDRSPPDMKPPRYHDPSPAARASPVDTCALRPAGAAFC
jgi:hypothetical protein